VDRHVPPIEDLGSQQTKPLGREGPTWGKTEVNSNVTTATNISDKGENLKPGTMPQFPRPKGATSNIIPLNRQVHARNTSQKDGPRLVSIADVERENVAWLWFPYIPKGKLTIMEGDPGIGKSFITMALAADLSQGRPLWGQDRVAGAKQKVLLLSAEDGLGDTIRPRLEAMSADLHQIVAFNEPFNLHDSGLASLEQAIDSVKPAIVIIDPLVAYTSGAVDMHRANQVREFMKPLAQTAQNYDCALVVVRHLKKGSGGGKGLYQGLGFIDYTAAARSVLMVGINRDGTRVMAHVKSNLAKHGHTLAYELAEDGSFRWLGKDETTAEELVAEPEDPETRTARQDAKDWLCERLTGEGWVPSKVLEKELEALDFSMSTYKRARRDLKKDGRLKVEQNVGLGDGWFVCLEPAQSVTRLGTDILTF